MEITDVRVIVKDEAKLNCFATFLPLYSQGLKAPVFRLP